MHSQKKTCVVASVINMRTGFYNVTVYWCADKAVPKDKVHQVSQS